MYYHYIKFDCLTINITINGKTINGKTMFTWSETVAISIIHLLKDPELVIHFLKILMPLRRDFVEEEARDFHLSFRVSSKDRWLETTRLRDKGLYNLMNASVPITFPIATFDGSMWRNACKLKQMIEYFKPGFIRRVDGYTRVYGQEGQAGQEGQEGQEGQVVFVDDYIFNKVNTVNILHNEHCSSWNSNCTLPEIREALKAHTEIMNEIDLAKWVNTYGTDIDGTETDDIETDDIETDDIETDDIETDDIPFLVVHGLTDRPDYKYIEVVN